MHHRQVEAFAGIATQRCQRGGVHFAVIGDIQGNPACAQPVGRFDDLFADGQCRDRSCLQVRPRRRSRRRARNRDLLGLELVMKLDSRRTADSAALNPTVQVVVPALYQAFRTMPDLHTNSNEEPRLQIYRLEDRPAWRIRQGPAKSITQKAMAFGCYQPISS